MGRMGRWSVGALYHRWSVGAQYHRIQRPHEERQGLCFLHRAQISQVFILSPPRARDTPPMFSRDSKLFETPEPTNPKPIQYYIFKFVAKGSDTTVFVVKASPLQSVGSVFTRRASGEESGCEGELAHWGVCCRFPDALLQRLFRRKDNSNPGQVPLAPFSGQLSLILSARFVAYGVEISENNRQLTKLQVGEPPGHSHKPLFICRRISLPSTTTSDVSARICRSRSWPALAHSLTPPLLSVPRLQ